MEFYPEIPSLKSDFPFRLRHETLRALLNRNGHVLSLLSDLEADLRHLQVSDQRIQRPVERLASEILLMAQELNLLSRNRHTALYKVIDRLEAGLKVLLRPQPRSEQKPLIIRFDGAEVQAQALDASLVGGKALGVANLRALFPDDAPPGFTITTSAYQHFIAENGLSDRIRLMLKDLDAAKDRGRFSAVTDAIRNMVLSSVTPKAVVEAIDEGVRNTTGGPHFLWAVRSSAVSEDSRFSFAGQFDSILNVPAAELADAYRKVLASRFSDRAVMYRLNCGFREVDTPMAVLFMPMIDPAASGVLYTADPQDPEAERMVMAACPGLGGAVVKGLTTPDTYHLSRQDPPVVLKSMPVNRPGQENYLSEAVITRIGALGFKAMTALGHDLDLEWAVDARGKAWLLQGRRLYPATQDQVKETRAKQTIPLMEGGATVFPGRAEGPVVFREAFDQRPIPKGAVLVVSQPTPELGPLLSHAAALLAEEGSPAGHLATLVREFSIPSIFRLGHNRLTSLKEGSVVSVDATKRAVYEGSRWPGIKERVMSRLSDQEKQPSAHPLHDAVLALNLTDPFASSFKPSGCRSLHDVVRFIHEMAVRQMFQFGDSQSRAWRSRSRKLRTQLPMKIKLLELEPVTSRREKDADPKDLDSIPFQAFWKGFSDPSLAWPERWEKAFGDVPPEFREQVFGGAKGPRRAGDANYLTLARDYLNFNARFAYHYAMVDAFVGPGNENNYVHFRLHGGGGSEEKRRRRARFIEWVLREKGFGVGIQGDLVTAWLRRYPQKDSEAALETLGRLMVCDRQLDFLMNTENAVKVFAGSFLNGAYDAFS